MLWPFYVNFVGWRSTWVKPWLWSSMSERRSSWIIISFLYGRRLRSPTPILRGAILITSFQYETCFSTLSQQGLRILSSSWETVFPTPFSRDMVQQDRHGHPFSSTILYGSEVWRSCLLDSDWASIEKVQTLLLLHQMQSSNPSTHHPCKVWCLTLPTWDFVQRCLILTSHSKLCWLGKGSRQVSIFGLLFIVVHCFS